MRRASALLVIGACSFEHGALQGAPFSDDGQLPTPWLSGFRDRKPIHITPPPLTVSLSLFPLGVRTATDPDLTAHARTDGRDVTFTAADGTTRLDHELVAFDATTGALEAWVRMPELAGATTILMYYGGDAQTPVTTTWSAPYAGVWHLDEGAGAVDSTPHDHSAVASAATTTPASVDGISGHARSFDGIDDSLTIAHPADGSLDFGTSSFSFSLWVNPTTSNNTFDSPLYKGGASTGDPGYCVLLGIGDWHVKVHDGTKYVDPHAGTETLSEWVYLVAVVDRAAQQMSAFRNGVLLTTQSLAGFGSVTNTKALVFGPTAMMPFHGLLDEVHLIAGVLSPEWVATEYANLTSPTFAVFGAQQTRD